jgi:HEAT repeat protein
VALEDETFTVRITAVLALKEIGGDGAKVVPALARLVRDEQQVLRSTAILAIGAFEDDMQLALEAIAAIRGE